MIRSRLFPFAWAVTTLLFFSIPLAAHAQVPTCTLNASPSVFSLVSGSQTVTLTLTSTNASAATINQGVGSTSPNGTKQVSNITETKTFTATVTGSGGSATCSVTVFVEPSFGAGGGSGAGGGGGGPSGLEALQALGQTLSGLGQLQSALGGSNAQNAQCNPVDVRCPCGIIWVCTDSGCGCKRQGPNMHQCTCVNNTAGFTTIGRCLQPNKCFGDTSGGGQGALGGGQQGLGQGMQVLSSILQGLQGLMGGGGGSGGGGGGYPYPNYTGCTQFYYTSTPTSDPCGIYQPGVSGQLTGTTTIQPNLISDLLKALGGSSTSTNTNINTNAGTNTNSLLQQRQTNNSVVTQTQVQNNLSATNTGQLQSGLTGDVRLGGAGATVFANLRQGLTEVAGFFGGNTFGDGSQSALARVCAARPWAANNFLGNLAPDGFFDNLCRRAGYEPGRPLTSGGGGGGGTQTTSNTTFTAGGTQTVPSSTTTSPYIPPEVDIRAEPPSVRLGARTYIFWNSRGVSACTVSGPSFSQSTLFGAGATVPITGPTTFTIECLVTNSSSTVRDSVTVDLAI